MPRLSIATSVLFVALHAASARAEQLLFHDDFQRPDSASPGAAWREFVMRGSVAAGDSPWSIRGGSLAYEFTGRGQYVEDFVVTEEAFPVDGTRVEFDWRGQVSTRQGYVGPAALWLDEPSRRVSAYNLKPGPGLVGLAAWHKWETQGARGVLLYGGVHHEYAEVLAPGLNASSFAHHAITVRDGKVTWEASGAKPITLPLDEAIPPGARRRFMFAVRLYDAGVPQRVEIKNFRVTALGSSGPAVAQPATPTPPQPGAAPNAGGFFFQADVGGRKVRLEALAGSHGPDDRGGSMTSLRAAPARSQLFGDSQVAALSFRGARAGTYAGRGTAVLSFKVGPQEYYLSDPQDIRVVVKSFDGRTAEGSFTCRADRVLNEAKAGAVQVQGSFRAPVAP